MLNLMLVDDEKTVIQGLTYILTKHCPEYRIVSTAQNASEALRNMQETAVDVVITDVKMPEMDGVKLTKEIRQRYPQTSVLVLSGYADFEYVRQAMKNGASDYLLKPCNYRNVLEILRNIEAGLTFQDNKSKEENHKTFLANMLTGKFSLPDEWAPGNELQMAVISAPGFKEALCEERLRTEFHDWCTDAGVCNIVSIDNHIVIVFHKTHDLKALQRKLVSYRQNMFKEGYQIYSVINYFIRSADCLHRAYKYCIDMLEFVQFNELAVVLDIETYRRYLAGQQGIKIHDFYYSQTIGRYIAGAESTKLQQYLDRNLNRLYQHTLDPLQVKNEVLKELIHLERYLKEHGIDMQQAFDGKMQYMHKPREAGTFRQLLSFLKSFTMSIMMNVSNDNRTPNYIHSAVQYIKNHYMEDISLKSVSDAVYLNPWYFSTQFKKFMNISFSEYLNQERVRMAKEFLKQRDLKIYQVAEMVGFQDAAYFSTVFKQLENISPKHFQKIL